MNIEKKKVVIKEKTKNELLSTIATPINFWMEKSGRSLGTRLGLVQNRLVVYEYLS